MTNASQYTVILDRDNTINADPGYLNNPANTHLLPGAAEGIALLNRFGVRIFVASNQSGVARGLISETQLAAVNEHITSLLRERGAMIGKIYVCPHGDADNCDCRKPKPGLIRRIIAEQQIDPLKAYVVGDRARDLSCGLEAKIPGILVGGKDGIVPAADHANPGAPVGGKDGIVLAADHANPGAPVGGKDGNVPAADRAHPGAPVSSQDGNGEQMPENMVFHAANLHEAASFILEDIFERETRARVFSHANAVMPVVEAAKAAGKRVVFTNGCFDLLHSGHVQLLAQARALGDFLLLGLNSDRSVRTLKGPSRPVNSEADRARILAQLPYIDAVVIFDEDTPVELLSRVKPAIHVKGGDYVKEKLPEYETVRQGGGDIVILPFRKGYSTTSILSRSAAK